MAERLAQHLISRGLLPASKVDAALRLMNVSKGGLDSALLEQGLVSEAGLLQALSDVSGLQPVNLADFEPNLEAAAQLPRKIAERLSVAPLSVDGGTLHLAICYPQQKEALKEVSFLLGKKLELWVAVECRVHDWNASVYDAPLAPRFDKLLRQLDPNRRSKSSGLEAAVAEATELVSDEVLKRVASGQQEEPILLDRPRVKRRPTLEIVADADLATAAQDTVFITPAKYGVLKKEKALLDDDGREQTSVLDLDQYADFARQATVTATSDPNLPKVGARPPPPPMVTPARRSGWDDTTHPGEAEPSRPAGAFRFPGGVMPPSKKTEEKPRSSGSSPLGKVTPAAAARPRISATRPQPVTMEDDGAPTKRGPYPSAPDAATRPAFSSAARAPLPPEHTPLPATTAPIVTAAPAVPRDETDFSDLRSNPNIQIPQQLAPSAPPAPTVVPAPQPPAVEVSPTAATLPVEPEPAAEFDVGAWQPADAPFQMPTPEEWASLPPEAQAAWWQQYQAAYGDAWPTAEPAEAAPNADGWPPNSGGSAEGWVASAPNEVQPVSDEFSVPVDMTSGENPLPRSSGPDQLPPEDDTWVALPPGARPLATGMIPPPPPPPSAPTGDAAPSGGPTHVGPAPSGPTHVGPAPSGPPPPPPSSPGRLPESPSEWTLPIARAALKGATQDRERLLEVALRFGQRAFDFCASFAVVRGVAVGWTARGEGDDAMIRQVVIPLDVASVFRTVTLTRGSYVGPVPNDALTTHYLALMGRTPRALFVWPLEVKGRLVAILYGDCGAKPISQRKLSDFMLFCNELPAAFHELLVFRKQRLGAHVAFTPAESGDARPEAIGDAETATDVPVVPDPNADDSLQRELLNLLTGPDAGDRAGAMGELMKTPDASARVLTAAFPGPTAWSRLPVVELPEADELGPIPGALARLGRAAAAALVPLLDSTDSDQRYLALLTAGSLHYPEMVDGIVRALFDPEPDISSAARAAATAMKGLLKFDAQVPDLRRELIARDPMNRSLAARALGVLRDRGAVVGLIDLVDDADELCAQSAVESLREVTRQNFGNDRDAWLRWWEGAKGQRRIEWLISALESADFEARLAAIDELSRAHGDNLGYFADGAEMERAQGAQRWAELLQKKPELEV